jgi:hypothetical protein
MTPQNIRNTCLKNGMTAACYRPPYVDSGCTMYNGQRSYWALSIKLCGNEDWVSCQALNDGFWYMANYGGNSRGVHNGEVRYGNSLTNLWSYCTKQD